MRWNDTRPSRRDACRLALMAAAGAALRPASAGAEEAPDTLTVAIGQHGNWENSVAELGQQAGFFGRHGIALNIIYTQGSGETLQAVISGSADVGIGVGTASAIGAFAKGAPIRAIANQTTGAPAAYWYVPASSPIRSLADAAGHTIAYSTNGSSNQAVLLSLLKERGITAQPVGTGSPPATFTQAMSGQVDVGWASPPFGLEAVEDGKIRVIARGSDVPSLRDRTVRLQIANTRALDSRRPVFDRYLSAYAEALHWLYSDPKALAAYAASIKTPERVAQRMRDEFYPERDLDLKRLSGVQAAVAEAIELKYIGQKPDEADLARFFTYARPDL